MVKRERPGLMGRIGPTAFVAIMLLATSALVLGALVLVEPDGNDAEDLPEVSFVKNETRDALRVNTTEPGLVWDDLQIQMDRTGGFMVQGGENMSQAEPMVFQRIDNESQIEVGDRLLLCLDEGGRELDVTLRHSGSATVIETFHFSNVAACTPDEAEPEAEEHEPDEERMLQNEGGEGLS